MDAVNIIAAYPFDNGEQLSLPKPGENVVVLLP